MSKKFEPVVELTLNPSVPMLVAWLTLDLTAVATLMYSNLHVALVLAATLVLLHWRVRFLRGRMGHRLLWFGSGALCRMHNGETEIVELRDARLLGSRAVWLAIVDAAGAKQHLLVTRGSDRLNFRQLRQRLVAGNWQRLAVADTAQPPLTED